MLNTRAFCQQLMLDKGVLVNGLWCFPTQTDSLIYKYLPNQSRLAMDVNGNPKFSFLRYITTNTNENASSSTITQADGGGILHFLVLYETNPSVIATAGNELKKLVNNDNIVLQGPVIFESGTYALVSSILNPDSTTPEKIILATGSAPVLAGNSIALTFELPPKDSKLLLESLKMPTPDVSILFDMAFSGLSDNYNARLEVNWEMVQKHQSMNAHGSAYWVGADIEMAFDDLFRDNAIKLTTVGSDAHLEGLMQSVYDKLLNLMFEKVEAKNSEDEKSGTILNAITGLVGKEGLGNLSKISKYGINIGYNRKEYTSQGKSVLLFQGKREMERHHFITFNAGNLYKQYGSDDQIFKDVALYDPAFQQREVFVSVDGSLKNAFDHLLNSVTVTLNKKHQSGQETVKEIVIKRQSLTETDKPFSMIYGNDQDVNMDQWLTYSFHSVWQFQGGGSYQTGQQQHSTPMINLFTPFRRYKVQLEGDLDHLYKQNVRAIVVKIQYPFFDQIKSEKITIKPGDILSDAFFEITLPNNQEEISYSITWITNDGKFYEKKGTDELGIIFIDQFNIDQG